MSLAEMLNVWSRINKIFRVIGKTTFVIRLHDFLLHEGKRTRVQVLAETAKIVLNLEEAEGKRIANSRSTLELMKAAGFPEEKIQAALASPDEMRRVNTALSTLLQYIDSGAVTIRLVVDEGAAGNVVGVTSVLDDLDQRQKQLTRSRVVKDVAKANFKKREKFKKR